MSQRKIDELLSGNYDGIQEYDNDLPKWWLYLFYITIAFAVVYTGVVHFSSRPTDTARLAAAMSALQEQQMRYQAAHAPAVQGPEALIALASDSTALAKGSQAYATRCAACHGQKGEGVVGPNLTDEYWLHGGRIEQIHHVIEAGVVAKGMLAWKGIMPQEEIDAVTAYIWSIRNTNVPGKAPQGEKQ